VRRRFSHPLKQKMKDLYRNMCKRCGDPSDKRWSDYGGRGITVCSEWRGDRHKFYQWCAENGIESHLQIDRIDNNKNYEPSNCKFSTRMEQAVNTRKNVFLEWNGKRQTISQWAREVGVKYRALQHRIDRGWSIQRIFTQPYRGRPNGG
jgi:hypothetical protein